MSDDIKPADPHAALRLATDAATQGEWYHVNPFMVLPATRTVHGPVPAERVDYVSTHPGLGTPPGNRVVIPMARDGVGVRSEDMAYIALCSPPRIKALLEERDRLEAERDGNLSRVEECYQIAGRALGYPWFKDDQKNFPGATEEHGVCCGEHVAETVVEELASKYQATEAEARRLRTALGVIGNGLNKLGLTARDTRRMADIARTALSSKTEGA